MTNEEDFQILDTPDGPVLRDMRVNKDFPFLTADAARKALSVRLTEDLVGSPARFDVYLEPAAPTSQGGAVRGDSVLDLAAQMHRARRVLNELVVLYGHESTTVIAASHELHRLSRYSRRLMAA